MPRFLNGTKKKTYGKSMNLNDLKFKMERDAMINALRMSKGNKKRASEILQIDRSVFYKKMEQVQNRCKGNNITR